MGTAKARARNLAYQKQFNLPEDEVLIDGKTNNTLNRCRTQRRWRGRRRRGRSTVHETHTTFVLYSPSFSSSLQSLIVLCSKRSYYKGNCTSVRIMHASTVIFSAMRQLKYYRPMTSLVLP